MTSSGVGPRERIEAWRAQQADRVDRLHFHFIDALERRASGCDGAIRQVLDAKLSSLIEAYAGKLDRTANGRGSTGLSAGTTAGAAGLAGLVEQIAGHKTALHGTAAATGMSGQRPTPPTAFPELAELAQFREIWERVRSEGQMRQSLQQAPADAGPLNSGVLVHRSLVRMRELSPAYLQHFLSYVDNLSWLEQLHAYGILDSGSTTRSTGGGKAARPRQRKRRD